MTQTVVDLCVGFLAGGLVVSATWGFFWLAIGVIGLSRGTCGWGVVLKSLMGGLVPMFLLVGLVWWESGTGREKLWFGIGLTGVPMVLLALGLRRMPDGKLAGTHLIEGIRYLMGDILGTHQGCGGCDHEHDHETCR
ncbi:MAG: hypothetical protein H8K03_05295 [Nitrospira sp.]|nr:hypothetical protein [Nitrospira sp. BO4]